MSTDVAPNRLAAAKEAGKQFTDELTPGINLGLVAFAGNASLLVAPTTNRTAMKAAIDQLSSRTHRDWGGHLHRAAGHCYGGCGAGRGRRTACAGANRAGIRRQGDGTVRPGSAQGCLHRRPRRQRTRRTNLDNLFRQISTISFGTPDGYVEINDQRQPVPVDDETPAEHDALPDRSRGRYGHGVIGLSRLHAITSLTSRRRHGVPDSASLRRRNGTEDMLVVVVESGQEFGQVCGGELALEGTGSLVVARREGGQAVGYVASSARTDPGLRRTRSLSRSQSAATAAYWCTAATSTGRPGTANIRT